ncbi:MAG: protein arginine kinase [Defluviitaleaceae bacterium]|nr:protein arginine kinase [Defluviitaleaceae bacterium]
MKNDKICKWYESEKVDEGIIISARVRLARNFEKYHFPNKIKNADATDMMEQTARAVTSAKKVRGSDKFTYTDMTNENEGKLLPLMERHVISHHLLKKNGAKGIILSGFEDKSIMLNEEDHVRIQSIFPGDNLEAAFEAANKLDDIIEKHGDNKYAFDEQFGYLTACPTNVGTGLRVSLMLHLPVLERLGFISKILPTLSKVNVAVRGIHGEGSDSLGSIYQISNQCSIGKTEQELLHTLKGMADWVIKQEKSVRDKHFSTYRLAVQDKLYRSYGVLTNCRRLGLEEGMKLLSDLRLGLTDGLLDIPRPQKTIYALMTEIQPGSLCEIAGRVMNKDERHAFRAEYVRKQMAIVW